MVNELLTMSLNTTDVLMYHYNEDRRRWQLHCLLTALTIMTAASVTFHKLDTDILQKLVASPRKLFILMMSQRATATHHSEDDLPNRRRGCDDPTSGCRKNLFSYCRRQSVGLLQKQHLLRLQRYPQRESCRQLRGRKRGIRLLDHS